MTNTERRSAIEVDDLPPWDDAETLDRLAAKLESADTRQLAAYGLDSDNQTLVGIGPIERARRSRGTVEEPKAAEKPDRQRMPQSEPPGPFIAAEKDELAAFVSGRKLGGWAIALPAALLVAAAALVLLRGRAPVSPPATELGRAVVASPAPAAAVMEPAPMETQAAASPEPAEPAEPAEVQGEPRLPALPAARPRASQVSANAAGGVAALPVKLPEVSSPVLVDRSSGTDVNVGTINVTSNPPASVVLDGRPLGKAPRLVRVPAGVHSLVFIHPLYGRRSLRVSVRPGVTTSASAEF